MWNQTLWTVLVDASAKSAVLLLLTWLTIRLLMRHSSAARRHLGWTGVLCACLLMPGLSALLPQWQALPNWEPLPPAAVSTATPVVVTPSENTMAVEPRAPMAQIAASPAPIRLAWWTQITWRQWLLLAWLTGVAGCLLPLAIGRLAVARICRSTRPGSADVLVRLSDVAATPHHVSVLLSARCRMPMACGILRRRVILPEEAENWSQQRTQAVLDHELAHVRRGDCLWQTLGQLTRALYWFNPLAWMAYRQLLCEAERACDDAVLTQGSRASSYAEHLMAVATGGRSQAILAAAAIAMARPTTLEGRLMAILDSAKDRRHLSARTVLLSVFILVCLVAPLAMLKAQANKDDPQLRAAVQDAIRTISACAEGDPRIDAAFKKTAAFDKPEVVREIVPFLDSKQDTIRRSAIYMLMQGEYPSIGPAEPKLLELTTHPEQFTRGMALIALGKNHIQSAIKPLSDATLHDQSPYVRRSAAYALGELGNPDALPILQQAQADPDANVAKNATVAAGLLRKPGIVPTTTPAPKTTGPAIRVNLVRAFDMAKAQTFEVAEGATPKIEWEIEPELAKTVGYQAVIVAHCASPDLANTAPRQIWEMMNVPANWAWGVMNVGPETRSIAYGQVPADHPGAVEIQSPAQLRTGYYMLCVFAYQGTYSKAEGRQDWVRSFSILKVGNPPEPVKVDYSKLTAKEMGPKLHDYVESFFKANYHDITARKTLEWGDAKKQEDGNWSIRYKYEATIWNKDKVIQDKVFTFTPAGGFVSVTDADKPAAGKPEAPATNAAKPSATVAEVRALVLETKPVLGQLDAAAREVDARGMAQQIAILEPRTRKAASMLQGTSLGKRLEAAADQLAQVARSLDSGKAQEASDALSQMDGTLITALDAYVGLSSASPQVVSVDPASLAKDVPVTLKEIRVVFDRPMATGGFSFVGGGPAFPKTTAPARWVDDHTCVLPVELAAGHDYWLSLNNNRFRNFQSKDGQPLDAYPIWFQTAGGKPAGPPKVTQTTPAGGSTDVDPALTEIRVTFDQPMADGGMAWVGGGEDYPEVTGRGHWIDDHTCALPVKLKPNHNYCLSLNSSSFMGFSGTNGVPALPRALAFKTIGQLDAANEPDLSFSLTAKKRSFAHQIAPGLELRVERTELGWEAGVFRNNGTDNLLYPQENWHGAFPCQLSAWSYGTKGYPNERVIKIRDTQDSVEIRFIDAVVSGERGSERFTRGHVEIRVRARVGQ